MAAKVTGVLELNNAPFLAALEASKSASKAFTTSVVAGAAVAASAMIVASGGVLAVGMAVKSLSSFITNGIAGAVAFGNSAYQAAQKFKGISTGENFLWLKALEKSGMSADEALGAMKQMSDQGMKLTEIFSSPADAAAAIKEAKDDYGDIASAIDKSAGTMAVMVNNFTAFKDRLQGFFIGFVSQVATPMNDLLVLLKNSFSTTEFGVSLGKKVSDLINILKGGASEGNFGEVVGALIKIALIDGAKKLNEVIKSISAYFSESFKGFGGILQAFGSILKSVFEYGATYISSKLQEAFEAGYKGKASGIMGTTESKNITAAQKEINSNIPSIEHFTKQLTEAKKSGDVGKATEASEILANIQEEMGLLQRDIAFNQGNFASMNEDQMAVARFRSQDYQTQKSKGVSEYRQNDPEAAAYINRSMYGDALQAIKSTSKYAGANASMAQANAEFSAAQANSGAGITGIAGGMQGFISGLEESRTAAQSIVDKARKAGVATANEPVRPPQVNNILTATPLERITTSLGKIGGGGGSMYVGMDIQAQNAAQTARNTKAAADDLAVIREKLTTAPAPGGERLMKD